MATSCRCSRWALLWMRWQPFRPCPLGERWLGLAILVGALGDSAARGYMPMNPLDRYSFLVRDLRIVSDGRWVAHTPLGRASDRLPVFHVSAAGDSRTGRLWRLQTVASAASTFVLQTLGVAAFRQGNLINISGWTFVRGRCLQRAADGDHLFGFGGRDGLSH